MCNDSWGRSSFSRCLIEVNSEVDLVDVVTIGIPSLSKDDFTKETIRVEYEWRPPRCDTCKIFGHVHDYCPKKVVSPPIVATSNVVTPNAEKTNDGFQTVGKKKKRKGKSKSTNGGQFTGPSVKHNVRYEPKATTSAPKKGTTYVGYTSQSTPMLKTTGNSSKKDNLSMSNSFSALNEEDEEDVENVVTLYPKNLSELDLKKILIDKMESNKSIHRSDEQKNLYKALFDAYESDKLILDTYGDTVSFKRGHNDEDKDEESSARSNRGSKRRRARKEAESTSAPKEKTSKITGKSIEGSKSHHKSAGESAQAEEPMHTAKDLEEPAHQEFETRVTEDQPDEETSQLRDWF
ncbi:hypothetical protein Tco_0245783 [Tanacetum coccineum]